MKQQRYERKFEETDKPKYKDKAKFYESESNSYGVLLNKQKYNTKVESKKLSITTTNNKSTSIASDNKFLNGNKKFK